jgi:hypothetical protein
MIYNNIIVDAQNLYWRSVHSSLKKCLDGENDKIYSNSIQEFLDRANKLRNTFGTFESKLFLLFDNPLSITNKRKSIDVNYKHSRDIKNVPKNFYKTLDCLQEILKVYKNFFYIIRYDGLEADDLVYPLFQTLNKKETKLVVSADMDWSRALGIDDNCNWFNFFVEYNKEKFKEKYEFCPNGKSIQMYKAIRGDNSDSIPNAVPYLPKTILIDIVEKYNTPNELFKNISQYPEKWKLKIIEAKNRIVTNYKLVDYLEYEKLENFIFECKENIELLRFYFNLYDLQFEARMFDSEKDNFFEKKKYRRIK